MESINVGIRSVLENLWLSIRMSGGRDHCSILK
jgi:hypothetical protein